MRAPGRRCGKRRSGTGLERRPRHRGDVAFYGTLDGWFKAADAKTGKVLWLFKVGSGVVGNPITYTGPDRKQYVAVYAGSAATGSCWRGTSGLMTRRMCGRRRTSCRTSPAHQPRRHRVDLRL